MRFVRILPYGESLGLQDCASRKGIGARALQPFLISKQPKGPRRARFAPPIKNDGLASRVRCIMGAWSVTMERGKLLPAIAALATAALAGGCFQPLYGE